MSNPDLYKEIPRDSELPHTYGGVFSVLDRLVPSGLTEEEVSFGHELEDPVMEATFRQFILTPALAQRMGLGDIVRCHIMLDGSKGAALVMRSRNLFNKQRYGFYIQPESNGVENHEDDLWDRTYRVWQAPVKAFSLGKRYWGVEKLKVEDAWLSSPRVANALIKSLLINDRGGSVS